MARQLRGRWEIQADIQGEERETLATTEGAKRCQEAGNATDMWQLID